jgi:aspartate/tyrosine/aromatic aminotransferase
VTFPSRALIEAPADPIFGIAEALASDQRPDKVNLAVGVYVDEAGRTPVLECVREAERRLAIQAESKNYRPILGAPGYRTAVRDLLLGPADSRVVEGRALTAQAPGGTGALRLAADVLRQTGRLATVWLPRPTWPNHRQLFALAGYRIREYPYLDPSGRAIDRAAMLGSLATGLPGDVVVLHGSCHNPSGVDPSPALWAELVDLMAARELLPIVDFAYQGFGRGLREDAAWLTAFEPSRIEFLVASSFSKNMALYNERVGGLTVVARDAVRASAAMSHVRVAVRANYSNPPAHGAAIAELILGDRTLRPQWEGELTRMRERIAGNRNALVDALQASNARGDWEPLRHQVGMFALLGLSDRVVAGLRDDLGIYVTGGGRINLAGLRPSNLGRVAEATAWFTSHGTRSRSPKEPSPSSSPVPTQAGV